MAEPRRQRLWPRFNAVVPLADRKRSGSTALTAPQRSSFKPRLLQTRATRSPLGLTRTATPCTRATYLSLPHGTS